MAKVLLLGYSPPPLAGDTQIEAAHYRTWQFLAPLLDAGHQVCLAADGPSDPSAVPPGWRPRLQMASVPYGRRGWIKALQRAHDAFGPDCVVAVNFSHCLYATRLRTPCPMWMDIYGDMLTIMQAAFYRAGSDRGLQTSLAFMRQVLRRGDLFSVCGTPQRHATVGELAMVGRLNRHTFGYEFVRVVLPGAPPCDQTPAPPARPRSFLRTWGVEDGDFVVLWCGGYNTWTDVDTLFAGLEEAMARHPSIRYVSVGANTYQGPDNVYQRFLAMVERSPFRERFHMLGWRPWTEIARFYRESDVGLNIDALHYETLYGTRTRLVEMIGAGLPVVTTLGPELSYLLEAAEAARTFAIGDATALARHLVELATEPGLRDRLAANALRYAREELSFERTTRELRKWVAAPSPAPDRRALTGPERIRALSHWARAYVRQGLWRVAGLDR